MRPMKLFFFGTLVLVAGCGQDVCVMGIGRCEVYQRAARQTPNNGNPGDTTLLSRNNLRLTTQGATTISRSTPLVVTATGGDNRFGTVNYTFHVIPPTAGTFIDVSPRDPSKRLFTAAPTANGAVTLKVTDSNFGVNDLCLTCTLPITVVP